MNKTIFISIPWFLPAYKAGGPIQSIANMVQQLGDGDCQFKIFTSNKDLDGGILNVEFDRWVQYSPNTQVWYVSKKNLLVVLEEQIEKHRPDYLFIIGIYSWFYNIKPLLFTKKVKKIISVRGMLHPGALSQKTPKKKFFLNMWKVMGLHKKHVFHATDNDEKHCIMKMFGSKVDVKIAGNFPRLLPKLYVVSKTVGQLNLVSIGLLSPMKNILLVLESLQAVQSSQFTVHSSINQKVVQSSPDILTKETISITYNIYGPVKDEVYWQECLDEISRMPSNIQVRYHGNIPPENIEQALAGNHVFILPSKSENFGHAIIEALSAGRPVITSGFTPWVNLEDEKAGMNVSIEGHSHLQRAIEKFAAMKQEELDSWSECAREYALRVVDLEGTRNQYQDLFA